MSIKVLVADDSITIQKVIGIIFGGDEYSLTVVDNGKAAVDKALEIIPDILLIDALMPGMSGYEVAEIVRSSPSLAAKPILILTGSFEPFDEEKAKKSGADDFIAKPFESQQIITKVRELLDLGKSRSQSTPVSPLQQPPSVPEDFLEPTLGAAAPTVEIPAPDFEQQPTAPTDIWGAFTPETEPPAAEMTPPSISAPSALAAEPDVFAIVTEEEEAQLIQTAPAINMSPQHTGSQWVPVEENTFEFEEETFTEPPQAAFDNQIIPVQETSFGDIAFEEVAEAPSVNVSEPVSAPPAQAFAAFAEQEPEFEAPPIPAAPFAPLSDPVPAIVATIETIPAEQNVITTPGLLSEEQLKTALSSASKEVIERIVWEIVPDLAEVLIRDAIRKIKEGV